MGIETRIEIPLFLTFFSMQLLGPINTNLMIFRTCYTVLGYNKSECALLGNSNTSEIENLEKLVEPEANIIDLTRSMIEQIVGLTVCLFAGQWSDRFGRKPILVISQIGMVTSISIMCIISALPNISPWFFIISSIPSMMTGGFSAFLVATLSYISDVTTDETRGMSMAILECTIGVGILLGNVSSSYLFYATNYPSVYAISACLAAMAALYTFLVIPESLENIDSEGKTSDIFQTSNLKDMFKVLSQRRKNYNRFIIFLMTAILTVYIFINTSGNKTFLFLRSKLDWNLTQFTWYDSTSNVIFMFGTLFGTLVLSKWLNITESVLILLGFLSEMNGYLVRGLATNSFHVYFSTVLKLLGGLISPQSRTLIAKLVPTDEIGKIFSMITIVEFLFGIASAPVFTALYNATVDTNPAIYNFFCAGMCGLDVILILAVIILQIKTPREYAKMDNEEDPVSINNSDPVA